MRFAFFIVLLLSSVASGADLKTCASFTNADVVFAGKVAAIDSAQKSEELPDGTKKIRFSVSRNFKGADNPTFTLFSKSAFPFKKDETWIVFASNDIVYKSFAVAGGIRIEKKTESAQIQSMAEIASGSWPTALGGLLVRHGGFDREKPVEVTVTGKGTAIPATVGSDGEFLVELPAGGRFRVRIVFPFETDVVWPDRLLGTNLSRGNPTVFEYDVELEKGDCSYSKIRLR